MAFKTFVSGATLPASDLNTYLMNQAVVVCTSGTRPGSPPTGMLIYETDTDLFRYWQGSAWKTPMPTKAGRVFFTRNANVTSGTLVGCAPPTTAYHTASITDGSTSSNDTLTFLVDCFFSLAAESSGLPAASSNLRVTMGVQGDTGQSFQSQFTNWGGNPVCSITWSGAVLTGESVQIALHNGSTSANTVNHVHCTFIPLYHINA